MVPSLVPTPAAVAPAVSGGGEDWGDFGEASGVSGTPLPSAPAGVAPASGIQVAGATPQPQQHQQHQQSLDHHRSVGDSNGGSGATEVILIE
mmetsp:Transcript_2386/g.5642  ORF Transcript_2386/g.5642 Transcript_2386/m.5642 type:complete len:92 (-) Transcript_2386:1005-1280(-)